ncbi:hypothetical protein M758_1G300400, partial [Ceratodon purpureus]
LQTSITPPPILPRLNFSCRSHKFWRSKTFPILKPSENYHHWCRTTGPNYDKQAQILQIGNRMIELIIPLRTRSQRIQFLLGFISPTSLSSETPGACTSSQSHRKAQPPVIPNHESTNVPTKKPHPAQLTEPQPTHPSRTTKKTKPELQCNVPPW